jgi:rhamnogalacturonyl hydrolase YesR
VFSERFVCRLPCCTHASRHSLTFLSASDEGVFGADVYQARVEKEADSLAHWTRVEGGLHDMRAFHAWLYADHLCYAVPRQAEFGKRTILDTRLLESY